MWDSCVPVGSTILPHWPPPPRCAKGEGGSGATRHSTGKGKRGPLRPQQLRRRVQEERGAAPRQENILLQDQPCFLVGFHDLARGRAARVSSTSLQKFKPHNHDWKACLLTNTSPSRRFSFQPESDSGLLMEESDAFYVVRKGDIVGVYKNFSECQDQLSSSVCDPAVSVYKGYSLPKETEEYLASHGLKRAVYSINSVDLKEDLFGALVPCPIQQPDVKRPSTQKRLRDEDATRSHQMTSPSTKHLKLTEPVREQPLFSNSVSCILEFDGASKGNPGKAGAGAILRSVDGRVVSRLRQGLGIVTNNVAEYRALILGMKYALKKGFKHIRIQGDSKLVCNQVQGIWQTKHQNLVDLYKEATELKGKFDTCHIFFVEREFNFDADKEANLAVNLQCDEVYDSSVAD